MANDTLQMQNPSSFLYAINSGITPSTFVEIAALVVSACCWLCFELGTSGHFQILYRVKSISLIFKSSVEIIFDTDTFLTAIFSNNLIGTVVVKELATALLLFTQITSIMFIKVVHKCTFIKKNENDKICLLLVKMLAAFVSMVIIRVIEDCLHFLPDKTGFVGKVCHEIHPFQLITCCVITSLCLFLGLGTIRAIVKSIYFAEKQTICSVKPRVCLCVMVFSVIVTQLVVFGLTITQKVYFGLVTKPAVSCRPVLEYHYNTNMEYIDCMVSLWEETKSSRHRVSFFNPSWPPVLEVAVIAAITIYKKVSA